MALKIKLRRDQRLIGPAPEDGGIEIDAVLEETVGHEASKTAFPIELGADITDHLIQKPGLYTMRGVITDHPILWLASNYNHIAAETRHLSAYALMRDLWNKREVFSIETGFLSLTNAVLVSFTATKTAATANAFNFEAHIDEIVIVKTAEVAITSETVDPEGEGAVPEEEGGAKTPVPVDDRSAALTIFDYVFTTGSP